jgi:DNA repair exonuclease SbcCD ATPase subunit
MKGVMMNDFESRAKNIEKRSNELSTQKARFEERQRQLMENMKGVKKEVKAAIGTASFEALNEQIDKNKAEIDERLTKSEEILKSYENPDSAEVFGDDDFGD